MRNEVTLCPHGACPKRWGPPKAIRENPCSGISLISCSQWSRAESCSLLLCFRLPRQISFTCANGPSCGGGDVSSWLSGCGSQRRLCHNTRQMEPAGAHVCMLGRCRSGMGSDLYLAPVLFCLRMSRESQPMLGFSDCYGLRPCLGMDRVMLRGSWGESLRLENLTGVPYRSFSELQTGPSGSCSPGSYFLLHVCFCYFIKNFMPMHFSNGSNHFFFHFFKSKTMAI